MIDALTDSEIILSIVIVNSDGARDTLNCIDSIYQYPPCDPFEIILVDNCSRELCLPIVAERFPGVHTFSSPARQGFAKNYNLGIRQARGQLVLILNNDTLVREDALNRLIDAARQVGDGIIGPQLLALNGKIQTDCARDLISPARYVLNLLVLDLGLPTGKLVDAWRQRQRRYRVSGQVPCITGACMLLSRATLDQIGLLDEGFDFYFEDVEWCHRAHKFGLPVFYVAEARIVHLGDQALGKVKEWAKQSEYRSALKYFRAYYRWSLTHERILWAVVALNYLMRMLAFTFLQLMGHSLQGAQAYRQLFSWMMHQFPSER